MASEGPNSAGSGASNNAVGTVAWVGPTNITTSDNSYSSATDTSGGSTTEYLVSSSHGFSIPSGATIDGIVVEFERVSPAIGGGATDSRVRIVKGGTIGSTERSAGAAWSNLEAYVSFGSSSDLWGETWTDSDINAANFGAAISATLGVSGTAQVDHVRITVHYTESTPAPEFFGLNVQCRPAPPIPKVQTHVFNVLAEQLDVEFSPRNMRPEVIAKPMPRQSLPARQATVTMPLEPSLSIEPVPFVENIAARGIVPPPLRSKGALIVRPGGIPPDAPLDLGWNMTAVSQQVRPEHPRRRSFLFTDWTSVPNGPDAWLTNTFRSGKRLERPRLNRGWFAVPFERTPPFPDAWLTTQKPARFPQAMAGRSQFLFLTLPYAHDPVMAFFHDRKPRQAVPRAGQTTIRYVDRSDIANDYTWGLFQRSPIIRPTWKANTTRAVGEFETNYVYGLPIQNVHTRGIRPIWRANDSRAIYIEPTREPLPSVHVVRPVQRVGRGSVRFSTANIGDIPPPVVSMVNVGAGRHPKRVRPSSAFTPVLETTSTGIIQIGWLRPRLIRTPVILHRGPSSQLFFAPMTVDTYVRTDNRNSRGAGMGASSTGGSGRNRSSTGNSSQG